VEILSLVSNSRLYPFLLVEVVRVWPRSGWSHLKSDSHLGGVHADVCLCWPQGLRVGVLLVRSAVARRGGQRSFWRLCRVWEISTRTVQYRLHELLLRDNPHCMGRRGVARCDPSRVQPGAASSGSTNGFREGCPRFVYGVHM
jgi:hypothetical protein